MCFTGETTKEKIKKEGNKAGCYFFRRIPTKFDLFLLLSQEQANKIKNIEGKFDLEIVSESEPSVYN